MDTNTLRTQMMQLWKDTFHDSDAYIKLIFDAYFDPEMVEYELHQGTVVAALMAVPFTLGWMDRPLRGIYLCGLATSPAHRNSGIMTRLMDRMNTRAADMGFALSMLIPANDGLRLFYYDRHYVNATYRIENRYTNIHDFEKEYYANVEEENSKVSELKKRYFRTIHTQKLELKNTQLVDDVIHFIQDIESESSFVTIRHSYDDLYTIIKENIISKGEILISLNPDDEITGVAFAEFDNETTIYVQHLYKADQCSRYRILEDLNSSHPQLSIVVREYPEESERRALWRKNYVSGNSASGDGKQVSVERVYKISSHAQPYMMFRILDLDEILKFLAGWRSECKYSILVNDPQNDTILKYDIAKGEMHKNVLDGLDGQQRENLGVVVSLRQLQEILFRRPSDDHLVMEAFGIPRFVVNTSLMLD